MHKIISLLSSPSACVCERAAIHSLLILDSFFGKIYMPCISHFHPQWFSRDFLIFFTLSKAQQHTYGECVYQLPASDVCISRVFFRTFIFFDISFNFFVKKMLKGRKLWIIILSFFFSHKLILNYNKIKQLKIFHPTAQICLPIKYTMDSQLFNPT